MDAVNGEGSKGSSSTEESCVLCQGQSKVVTLDKMYYQVHLSDGFFKNHLAIQKNVLQHACAFSRNNPRGKLNVPHLSQHGAWPWSYACSIICRTPSRILIIFIHEEALTNASESWSWRKKRFMCRSIFFAWKNFWNNTREVIVVLFSYQRFASVQIWNIKRFQLWVEESYMKIAHLPILVSAYMEHTYIVPQSSSMNTLKQG